MIDKRLIDCIAATKLIQRMLNYFHYDPAEKVIIAMYLEEAARAECEEIDKLERMIK